MISIFDKPLDLLEEEDLHRLITNEIAEGLYVDYKVDFPADLPKVVASFANTFGGWLIIGADAANPGNLPSSFPGVTVVTAPKDRFRHICRDGLSPVPLFTTRLISLKDSPGRGVLVARIDESTYPPHITKDGRIYRRNSEGSDPVAETDRYTLDRLFEKSRRNKEQVKAFIDQKLAKEDTHRVLLKVMCCPVPLNLQLIQRFFVEDTIAGLKDIAREVWDPSLTAHVRYEPEGFSFERDSHRLEVLRSGMITYTQRVPVYSKTMERGTHSITLDFLDYNVINQVLSNTLEFVRKVYNHIGYLGLFIPKVALENISGKGLDDPAYHDYYLDMWDPGCRFADVVLPYGYSPLQVQCLEKQDLVFSQLHQLIYRCFGFEALEAETPDCQPFGSGAGGRLSL